jgi:hypothetical protein
MMNPLMMINMVRYGSKILEKIINDPDLLEEFRKKPRINLVRIQTITGSIYMGFIKDNDEEGIWFEPLSDDYHSAYILKKDLRKIMVPSNPEKEISTEKSFVSIQI